MKGADENDKGIEKCIWQQVFTGAYNKHLHEPLSNTNYNIHTQ